MHSGNTISGAISFIIDQLHRFQANVRQLMTLLKELHSLSEFDTTI